MTIWGQFSFVFIAKRCAAKRCASKGMNRIGRSNRASKPSRNLSSTLTKTSFTKLWPEHSGQRQIHFNTCPKQRRQTTFTQQQHTFLFSFYQSFAFVKVGLWSLVSESIWLSNPHDYSTNFDIHKYIRSWRIFHTTRRGSCSLAWCNSNNQGWIMKLWHLLLLI